MSMPASGQEDTTQLEESGFMSGLTRKQKIIVGTVAGGVDYSHIVVDQEKDACNEASIDSRRPPGTGNGNKPAINKPGRY
jgi:hypothetical protein